MLKVIEFDNAGAYRETLNRIIFSGKFLAKSRLSPVRLDVISIVKYGNQLRADVITKCKQYQTALSRFFAALEDREDFYSWKNDMEESCQEGVFEWGCQGKYPPHWSVEDLDGYFSVELSIPIEPTQPILYGEKDTALIEKAKTDILYHWGQLADTKGDYEIVQTMAVSFKRFFSHMFENEQGGKSVYQGNFTDIAKENTEPLTFLLHQFTDSSFCYANNFSFLCSYQPWEATVKASLYGLCELDRWMMAQKIATCTYQDIFLALEKKNAASIWNHKKKWLLTQKDPSEAKQPTT